MKEGIGVRETLRNHREETRQYQVNVQDRSKGELRGSFLQCLDCHVATGRVVKMKN